MPKHKPCLYLIKNSVNGKHYVGQTICGFKQRMRKHQCAWSDCTALKRAIAKYGWDNFQCEIIMYCNREFLDEYERRFIQIYDSFGKNGYNLTKGGGGMSGFKHSEAAKEKCRKASTGKKHSEKTKQKIAASMRERQKNYVGRQRVFVRSRCVDSEEKWIYHDSINSAAKFRDVLTSCAWRVVHGKRKKTGGYVFERVNQVSGS